MAIDILPDKLVVATRDALAQQFLRDVQLRSPAVAVGDGLLPNIDAAVYSDMLLPVFAEAVRQGQYVGLAGKTGTDLDQEALDSGQPVHLPASSSSGFVTVDASAGGGAIQLGQELRNLLTGSKFQAIVAGTYIAGQPCPVVSKDTGPATITAPGTILTWTSPPAGINPTAVVFAQTNGTGLTGGSLAETDAQMITRLRNARANPAVNGNDAAYQQAVINTPGLSVQAAFTYPAILGPGTTGILFLLLPSAPGANRIPNAAQIGLAKAWVVGQMGKDDSSLWGVVLQQNVTMTLAIKWAPGIASWTDAVPWPPSSAATYAYSISAGATPTSFIVTTADPGAVPPVATQTIGLFDRSTLTYWRKRILAVSGANPWTITVDTSNASSDTAFAPALNDCPVPWSDSLGLLVLPLINYFDTLGPGEELNVFLTPFFDAGYRQKRSPADPQYWPKSLTTKSLLPLLILSAVGNVTPVLPALPLDPNAGSAGMSAYLLYLNKLYPYPG